MTKNQWILVLLATSCSAESGETAVYAQRDGAAEGASCDDCDGDGYTKQIDCNDSNPKVHPGTRWATPEPFIIDPEHASPACARDRPCWDYNCDGRQEPLLGGTFDHGCSGEPLCCTDFNTGTDVLVTSAPGRVACGQPGQGFNGGYRNEERGCWELHTPVQERQPCR